MKHGPKAQRWPSHGRVIKARAGGGGVDQLNRE